MSRVVLLGGNGFIGTAIRRRLEALAVPVLAPRSGDLNLADASAGEKLAGLLDPADAIVMLAAITPDKGRDTAALMKNLAVMQSVCAAVARAGCAHFVYYSSDAVYDPEQSRVAEGTPASPQDLYGAMHCTREIMARGIPKLPVLVLRPTLVYGVEDTHNAYGPNRFRRAALKDGRIALFGGGEETRDHIHVDDVAALTVRCIAAKKTGTFNIATGTSRSFHEVAVLVARQFPRPVEIATSPRANPVTHRHYDVTNLVKAFPDFRFTALEDGVARVHQQMMEAAR